MRWQSQPKQALTDPDINTLIGHNEDDHSIYLFLRTSAKRVATASPYTFLGRLKYLTHDKERERPVYFTWQVLDWPIPSAVQNRIGLELEDEVELVNGSFSEELSNGESRLIYVAAPVGNDLRAGLETPVYRTRRIKRDYAEQDARNRKLGLAGEVAVFECERRSLIAAGREDLANRVTHVSVIEGDGAGYDIKSYTESGHEKYIDVKTTRGNQDTAFYVNSNEVAFASDHADSYYLYRIFEFDERAASGKVFVQRGSLNQVFQLLAVQYKVQI